MVIRSIGKKFVTTLIVLIFMFSALSVISANATDPNTQEQQNMVIKGIVLDGAANEPIGNALVLIWNERTEFKAESGEDGTFVFEVPHAPYKMKVSAEGYHPVEEFLEQTEHREVSLTFSLKPMEEKPDPMIVFGHVYDGAADKPIVGAIVYFHGEHHEAKAETGEAGGFEVKLPPGHYKVEVIADGYYPWVEEISGDAQDKIELKIVLKPQEDNNEERHWVHVAGIIYVADTERPIPRARVLFSGENDFAGDAVTNDDGYFELRLPEGIYHVQAWAEGFYDIENKVEILNVEEYFLELFMKPLREDERPDPDEREVEERERPRLSGRVFDAKTNKPMKAEVILEPEYQIPKMHYLLVGIRWGMLDCENTVCFATWDGFIQVTDGIVRPVRTVAFETGGEYRKGTDDHLYKQTNPMTVEWRSSTVNCWDGIILLIAVPVNTEPAAHVTFHTDQITRVVEFKDIINIHGIIQIDDCGNELEYLTKLIRTPDWERPERPPSDEDPEMPPDGPQDRPDNDMPPKEEPRTRGEGEEEPEAFGLEMPEEQLLEIDESIKMHIKEKRMDKIITKTNEKGYYAFRELRSGHYRMWVRAPGHIDYYNEFTIKDGQHLVIDVYLRPMAKDEPKPKPCIQVVKGIVVDARTGDPVANAKVTFDRILMEKSNEDYDKLDSNGKRGGEREQKRLKEHQVDEDKPLREAEQREMKSFSVMTNERGYFEIKLPCGMYKMTVEARGYEEHMQRLAVKGDMEMLKIPLKKSTLDPNSTDNTATSLNEEDEGEGVDTKSLGVQLYDGDSVNGAVQALLVVLLILGVLLPLLMVVRQQKARKRSKRQPERTARQTPATKRRIQRVSAKKTAKQTRPHFSKPMREF